MVFRYCCALVSLVGVVRAGRVGGTECFINPCEESKINQMYLILFFNLILK